MNKTTLITLKTPLDHLMIAESFLCQHILYWNWNFGQEKIKGR